MNIGLDYDDTYTRDPLMWDKVCTYMRNRGHKIYLVTWRFESEAQELFKHFASILDGVYPTGRKAKEKFMYDQGIRIDVWIDDNPGSVLNDCLEK